MWLITGASFNARTSALQAENESWILSASTKYGTAGLIRAVKSVTRNTVSDKTVSVAGSIPEQPRQPTDGRGNLWSTIAVGTLCVGSIGVAPLASMGLAKVTPAGRSRAEPATRRMRWHLTPNPVINAKPVVVLDGTPRFGRSRFT
jgi:hypothetical protein